MKQKKRRSKTKKLNQQTTNKESLENVIWGTQCSILSWAGPHLPQKLPASGHTLFPSINPCFFPRSQNFMAQTSGSSCLEKSLKSSPQPIRYVPANDISFPGTMFPLECRQCPDLCKFNTNTWAASLSPVLNLWEKPSSLGFINPWETTESPKEHRGDKRCLWYYLSLKMAT